MTDAHSTRGALLALSLAMLLSSLGTSVANVALPSLATAFHATFPEVQWIVLAYLLATTVSLVVVGRLGDVAGRKRLLVGGILVFTAASILCASAGSLALLITARAAQGVGAAAMLSLAIALVAGTVPKERSGRAMGLLATMSAIGTAVGPSAGGLLIASFGWRAIFAVNVPLGLVAAALAHRYLPGESTSNGGASSGWGAALRERGLAGALVTSGLVSTVMMATLVVGPFYLSRALGLDAARVGLVMSAGPIVAALTGVPAGRLGDRFGATRITLAGLVVLTIGSAMLCALPPTGTVAYLVPLVVMTAGYGLFQTSNNTAVMTGVTNAHRGIVSGMLTLSRNLGLIAGASVMGTVFAVATGGDMASARPDAVAMGMRTTFALASVLLAIALGIAAFGARKSQGGAYLKMSENASWSKRSSGLTSCTGPRGADGASVTVRTRRHPA
ncbi:MAG TPA: MFS transporter [Vicinamibacterales bacterium]